jgi:hypothetical protein
MLNSTAAPPSRGALRLLRQLALYGSFGTATCATAFVLEEQRRQICRLSKAVDNGRKLRKLMRQTHSGAAGPRSFAGYVQALEAEGLVARETVGDAKEPSGGAGGLQEYHWHARPRSDKSVRAEGSRKPVRATSSVHDAGHDAFKSARPRVPQRRYFRPLSLSESSPRTWAKNSRSASRPALQQRPANTHQPTTTNSGHHIPQKLWRRKIGHDAHRVKMWKIRPLKEDVKAPILAAFRTMIANRADNMDLRDFEQFLEAASREQNLLTVELLLDDCKSRLPWSKPLYPILLRSLSLVHHSTYLDSPGAISSLALCRRIMEEGELDPSQFIRYFHDAGAHRLVINVYQNHRLTKLWGPDERMICIESALTTLAAGSLDPSPLADLLRDCRHQQDLAGSLIPLIKNQSPGSNCSTYWDTVLRAYCSVGCEIQSSELLQHLHGLLLHFYQKCPGPQCRRTISALMKPATSSEAWYSTLLSFCVLWVVPSSAPGLLLYRKMVAMAVKHGFNLAVIKSYQTAPDRSNLQCASRNIGKAYLQVDKAEHIKVKAHCLKETVASLYGHKNDDVVISLFKTYFYSGFIRGRSLTQSWNSVLRSASVSEALDVLEVVQRKLDHLRIDQLDRVQSALIRRTWLRSRDFNEVQFVYDEIQKINVMFGLEFDSGETTSSLVWAFARAGRVEDVKRHARALMISGLSPDYSAIHHLIPLHARRGNWLKVQNILDILQSRGKLGLFLRNHSGLFVDIFHAFSEQRPPAEVLEFFKRSINVWGVIPGDLMIDHLISSCMRVDNGLEIIRASLDFLRSKGLDWQIRSQTVVMSYLQYARHFRPDSVFAVQLLTSLSQEHRGLISKDLCLQVLETCAIAARKHQVKRTHEPNSTLVARLQHKLENDTAKVQELALTAPWLSELSSFKTITQRELGGVKLSRSDKAPREQAQRFYSDMQIAASLNRPDQVISIYQTYLQQNLPRLALALDTVVNACLRCNDPSRAEKYIQEAKAAGQDVHSGYRLMLIYNLRSKDFPVDASTLRRTVFDAYLSMETHNEPINHALVVSAAHALIYARQPGAVALLTAVYNSEFARVKPFDIVPMTCFIAAYARDLNVGGVRWAIDRVLRSGMIIDLHFFKVLYQARKYLVKMLRRMGTTSKAQKAHRDFRIYDALCWRRFRLQRIKSRQFGIAMVKNLVALRQADDDREAPRVRKEDIGLNISRNAYPSRLATLELRLRNSQEELLASRRIKILRRKGARIRQWQDNGIAGTLTEIQQQHGIVRRVKASRPSTGHPLPSDKPSFQNEMDMCYGNARVWNSAVLDAFGTDLDVDGEEEDGRPKLRKKETRSGYLPTSSVLILDVVKQEAPADEALSTHPKEDLSLVAPMPAEPTTTNRDLVDNTLNALVEARGADRVPIITQNKQNYSREAHSKSQASAMTPEAATVDRNASSYGPHAFNNAVNTKQSDTGSMSRRNAKILTNERTPRVTSSPISMTLPPSRVTEDATDDALSVLEKTLPEEQKQSSMLSKKLRVREIARIPTKSFRRRPSDAVENARLTQMSNLKDVDDKKTASGSYGTNVVVDYSDDFGWSSMDLGASTTKEKEKR